MFRGQFLQLFWRCAFSTLERQMKVQSEMTVCCLLYKLASFHSTSDIVCTLFSSSTYASNKSVLQSTASARMIHIVPYPLTWITYPRRNNCHRQHYQHLGMQRREVYPYIDLSIKNISSFGIPVRSFSSTKQRAIYSLVVAMDPILCCGCPFCQSLARRWKRTLCTWGPYLPPLEKYTKVGIFFK